MTEVFCLNNTGTIKDLGGNGLKQKPPINNPSHLFMKHFKTKHTHTHKQKNKNMQ